MNQIGHRSSAMVRRYSGMARCSGRIARGSWGFEGIEGSDSPKKKFERFQHLGHYPNMEHLSDTDLERYYLGMIPDGPELAILEEHLLICGECVERAGETQNYVDEIQAGLIRGGFDL